MNYKDITIGIVSCNSEKVIFDCLNSIKKINKIIIFDNSNDIALKNRVTKKFPKINFIISKKNLGYGKANNRIINLCKTNYLFILNPDTILKKNCEFHLLKSINTLKGNFSIISPRSNEKNYGLILSEKKFKGYGLIEVNYVKGFAMLINNSLVKKIGMFDENIFLYLEEIDLCKRLLKKNFKIYINQKSEVTHLGARSSNLGFEFDKCRNWHWMWSNFYYFKKYNNSFISIIKFTPVLIYNLLKVILLTLKGDKKKKILYLMRFYGLLNSITGRKSWYRPKLK